MMSGIEGVQVIDADHYVQGNFTFAIEPPGVNPFLHPLINRVGRSTDRLILDDRRLTGENKIPIVALFVYWKFWYPTQALLLSHPIVNPINYKAAPYARIQGSGMPFIGESHVDASISTLSVKYERRHDSNICRNPRTLLLNGLALNGLHAVLRCFRLFFSNIKLLPRIHSVQQAISRGRFGLAGENLSLLCHFKYLHADEGSGSNGGEKTEYGDSEGSFRDYEAFSRQSEGLLLERFEIIPTDQSHQYWLGWLWIAASAACVGASGRFLWRGCRWLSDVGIGSLSFLLAFAGFFGIIHGIASL
jgi:hypothetical protein